MEGFFFLKDVEPICAILYFVEAYYALKQIYNQDFINI